MTTTRPLINKDAPLQSNLTNLMQIIKELGIPTEKAIEFKQILDKYSLLKCCLHAYETGAYDQKDQDINHIRQELEKHSINFKILYDEFSENPVTEDIKELMLKLKNEFIEKIKNSQLSNLNEEKAEESKQDYGWGVSLWNAAKNAATAVSSVPTSILEQGKQSARNMGINYCVDYLFSTLDAVLIQQVTLTNSSGSTVTIDTSAKDLKAPEGFEKEFANSYALKFIALVNKMNAGEKNQLNSFTAGLNYDDGSENAMYNADKFLSVSLGIALCACVPLNVISYHGRIAWQSALLINIAVVLSIVLFVASKKEQRVNVNDIITKLETLKTKNPTNLATIETLINALEAENTAVYTLDAIKEFESNLKALGLDSKVIRQQLYFFRNKTDGSNQSTTSSHHFVGKFNSLKEHLSKKHIDIVHNAIQILGKDSYWLDTDIDRTLKQLGVTKRSAAGYYLTLFSRAHNNYIVGTLKDKPKELIKQFNKNGNIAEIEVLLDLFRTHYSLPRFENNNEGSMISEIAGFLGKNKDGISNSDAQDLATLLKVQKGDKLSEDELEYLHRRLFRFDASYNGPISWELESKDGTNISFEDYKKMDSEQLEDLKTPKTNRTEKEKQEMHDMRVNILTVLKGKANDNTKKYSNAELKQQGVSPSIRLQYFTKTADIKAYQEVCKEALTQYYVTARIEEIFSKYQDSEISRNDNSDVNNEKATNNAITLKQLVTNSRNRSFWNKLVILSLLTAIPAYFVGPEFAIGIIAASSILFIFSLVRSIESYLNYSTATCMEKSRNSGIIVKANNIANLKVNDEAPIHDGEPPTP